MSTGLALAGVIGLLWFLARVAGGGGVSSFKAMFRREAALPAGGLGASAISTLLEDVKAMVVQDHALRGLILAGDFAGRRGTPESRVVLLLLTRDLARFAGRDWLARIAYIARGHLVSTHEIVPGDGFVAQHLNLRGAPPVCFYFIDAALESAPPILDDDLARGTKIIETSTNDAKTLLARWQKTGMSGNATPKD